MEFVQNHKLSKCLSRPGPQVQRAKKLGLAAESGVPSVSAEDDVAGQSPRRMKVGEATAVDLIIMPAQQPSYLPTSLTLIFWRESPCPLWASHGLDGLALPQLCFRDGHGNLAWPIKVSPHPQNSDWCRNVSGQPSDT